MKRFACGDIVPGCTATWQTDDHELLIRDVSAHAASAHGIVGLDAAVVEVVRERTLEIA